MDFFYLSFVAALKLIIQFDPDLLLIVWTSIRISLSAALLAALVGVPLGGMIAIYRFRGKRILELFLNSLMALPTVTIGLIFYGLLTRNGPLGEYSLLYTTTAIVIGEFVLILPIIVNLSISAVLSADRRLLCTLQMLGARRWQQMISVLREMRRSVMAGIVTGFGRAIGEVGVAMILGGNIQGFTRTMTTAIALETNKGEFEFALALGVLLLMVAFTVNLILFFLKETRP